MVGSKRARRYSPCGIDEGSNVELGEGKLLDTPVRQLVEGEKWTLMASRNKPLGYQ